MSNYLHVQKCHKISYCSCSENRSRKRIKMWTIKIFVGKWARLIYFIGSVALKSFIFLLFPIFTVVIPYFFCLTYWERFFFIQKPQKWNRPCLEKDVLVKQGNQFSKSLYKLGCWRESLYFQSVAHFRWLCMYVNCEMKCPILFT